MAQQTTNTRATLLRSRGEARASMGALALLAWLSLGQWQLFDRLLFKRAPDPEFVLANVHGILQGTPVWQSSQQRFLAPACIALLELLGLSGVDALRLFLGLTLLSANLVLAFGVRRAGGTWRYAIVTVACFGFARCLLSYKLEYPWDGLDVLLFLVFGQWAAHPRGFGTLAALLALGAINHETVLYLPLWLLLAGPRRERVRGALCAFVLCIVIYVLREAFYVGQPDLPGQVFEDPTPLLGNPLHVAHNARQLFVSNWLRGRSFVSLGFLAACGSIALALIQRRQRVAALWSLGVLASIFCFGYVNETRLYLPLIAFWFGHVQLLPTSAPEG